MISLSCKTRGGDSFVCAELLGHVQLFVTLWTEARQAPLYVGFARQEYWNGLPFPPPRDLPDPSIEPASPVLAAWFLTTSALWEAPSKMSDFHLRADCRYIQNL